MADEPDGTNGPDTRPPPPLADAPPPPLAEAPPAAAPPPPPVAAPARPFFSPLIVVLLVVALLAGVTAILYFGGVFDRLSGAQAEQTTAPTASAPASGTAPPAAEPGFDDSLAGGDNFGCSGVFTERDARDQPLGDGQQVNNIVVTAAGEIQWNGAAVEPLRLRQYLDIVRTMAPRPRTVVSVEPGAPAGAREQVSETISSAMNCRFEAG